MSGRRAPGALAAATAACLLAQALAGAQSPAPRPPRLPAVSPAVEQLRKDLLAETAMPNVRRAVWGVVVHSLDRDERLFDLNADTLFVPASAAKIVSALTAADAVGWDYRFDTAVRATGPIVDGVLTGDLIIVGSGDPTPEGRAGDSLKVWVDALKAAGVKRIEGRVIGDDDDIDEPRPGAAWSWEDLGYTSGALFGALNATENRMTVTIAPGAGEGQSASLSVEDFAQDRPLVNRAVTSTTTAPFVWPEQRLGEDALTITGSVRPGDPPIRLSISTGNPTQWFASLFRDRLIRGGVEVTGRAADIDDVQPKPNRAAATLLYTHRSQPLAAIARAMLKDSINLYGEALLRLNAMSPSAVPGAPATNDMALAGLRKRLDAWGIPRDAQDLVDGSGLSRRDLIAPEALYALLKRAFEPAGTSPFMSGLPVAGVDGSLAARMKDTKAHGNLRAKTGTMSNIRSLAGYMRTGDGEHLAIVVIVNNYEGAGADANESIDNMAVRLAGFTRRP
ncbi:MAG TPA: D-alanyl-D-alanine carboxypeptidase/D-alanyl-D-alanine-endopeptidase [Vicinamibacterales bacterium]|nr:D-alanyl-D-alanine carboxypeptidase/D-alanyl-D-alanine-endopeptidase [Vicinamibacterales bacterium]